MRPELPGRNLVLEDLVDLGRLPAGDLWEGEVSDNAREGTRSPEASSGGKESEPAIHRTKLVRTRSIDLQASRLHTPNLEHEGGRVVESQAETV